MRLVNCWNKSLTSIGGSVVWGFQAGGREGGENEFLDYGYSRLKRKIPDFKKFLGVELNSDLLAVFKIGDKNDKEVLTRKNLENFYLIKDEGYYSYGIYIFHNKKVKVVTLCFGDFDFLLLVNKNHLPKKYEIRNQWWSP